jgi:hypothetical protein
MVSQLPKKSCITNNNTAESSETENIKAASKRKVKCVVSKKSPVKKIKETQVCILLII